MAFDGRIRPIPPGARPPEAVPPVELKPEPKPEPVRPPQIERFKAKKPERPNAETFGIPKYLWDRNDMLTDAMRGLAPAMHRYETLGESEEEMVKSFAGVYSEKKIRDEVAEAEKLERAMESEDSAQDRVRYYYAMVLEKIVQDMANEWFPDCAIYRAHKFDDKKRQIDMFMEIPYPEGQPAENKRWERLPEDKKQKEAKERGTYGPDYIPPLAIALDVTFSRDKVPKKLERTFNEYRMGRLHDAEYFDSELDNDLPPNKKGRRRMALAVVGTSTKAVDTLANHYYKWLVASKGDSAKKEAAFAELVRQPLGLELYEEILSQLADAHLLMNEALKKTHPDQATRIGTLEKNVEYIAVVRKKLGARYEELKKEQAQLGAPEQGLKNFVRDAIVMTSTS